MGGLWHGASHPSSGGFSQAGLELPQPLPKIHPKAPGCALPYPRHFPAGFASPPSSIPPGLLWRPLSARWDQLGSQHPWSGIPPPWGPPEPAPVLGARQGLALLCRHTLKLMVLPEGLQDKKNPQTSLAAFPQSTPSTFWSKSYEIYLQEPVLSNLSSTHGTKTSTGSFVKLWENKL